MAQPDLEHAPRVRSVDPRLLPSLSSFRCGGDSPYETEVEQLLALMPSYAWAYNLRVAEDPADGSLLGFCAIQARPFGDPPEPDSAYIALIGVNAPFRGCTTPHGERIGDVLLEDALRQVRQDWGGGPMPRVWALVDPTNAPSHKLFDRHGFERLSAAGSGYDVRFTLREDP